MAYSIRRATTADRAHVEALLVELFPDDGEEGARRRYEWIHLGNPHGVSLVWLAIDDSGAVAGCATYFPRRIVVHGRVTRAVLGGDCWVRPAFRRRGIAKALHAAGRREMPEHGIEVLFGTPTKANETPLLQNGARNIGFATRFARPLRLVRVPMSELVLSCGWGGGVLEPVRGIDQRIDSIWDRVQHEIGVGTVRDGAFYDWRFARAPSGRQHAFVIVVDGEPIGACALECVDGYLRVVDLVAPRDRWGVVIGAVVDHARANHPDVGSITFRLVEEEASSRVLWRWGLLGRNKNVFNILLPEGEPRAEVYYDPRRWFLSFADTDVDRG
jgi:GNAT superfamily N-acetyltransferase